jgi:8-oxo-dGTP diphosphatase
MPYTYEYPRPAVTTDAILLSKVEEYHILLIERGAEPYKGCWALPGGFVEMDEELEDACAREVKEETGLDVGGLQQFYTAGTVGRDPRGRTISVVFWCEVEGMPQPQHGDDAAKAQWFPLSGLPQLAFDHEFIIKKFLGRNKKTS